MRLLFSSLLGYSFVHLSTSLPVEEKPGFTPWQKRAEIAADIFSDGSYGAQFKVNDDMCRGEMKDSKCWKIGETTVKTFLQNRKPGADECEKSCLFYTANLSGAAERESNWVLRAALGTVAAEGPRRYQTIWDLHDQKYYPNPDDGYKTTAETKCIFQDSKWPLDEDRYYDGCRRSYFRAMSKAMAMRCKGEVFVMTSDDIQGDGKVPLKGIWWDTEFPTLIDPRRPAEFKVEKITYLQVDKMTREQIQALPVEKKNSAPPIRYQGEYWPKGPGKKHLDDVARGILNRATDATNDGSELESSNNGTAAAAINSDFVKRAGNDDAEILEPGDEDYPFPYSIDDMVKLYGGITW